MFEEEEIGYLLVHENGQCGSRGKMLAKDVAGAADCAALAEGVGAKAFSLGIHYARGRCYANDLAVTADYVKSVQENRAHPPCSEGDWKKDALYDFYILEQL